MTDAPENDESGPDISRESDQRIANLIHAVNHTREPMQLDGRLPATIHSKKSWSDRFKEDAYKAELNAYRSVFKQVENIMHGNKDPMQRAIEIRKMAKQMGVKF